MTFVGTAVSTGWIIAGALLLPLMISGGVLFRDARKATEMPDYFSQVELAVDEESRMVSSIQRFKSREMQVNRMFIGNRGSVAGCYDKAMARRNRVRRSRPSPSSWN